MAVGSLREYTLREGSWWINETQKYCAYRLYTMSSWKQPGAFPPLEPPPVSYVQHRLRMLPRKKTLHVIKPPTRFAATDSLEPEKEICSSIQ